MCYQQAKEYRIDSISDLQENLSRVALIVSRTDETIRKKVFLRQQGEIIHAWEEKTDAIWECWNEQHPNLSTWIEGDVIHFSLNKI